MFSSQVVGACVDFLKLLPKFPVLQIQVCVHHVMNVTGLLLLPLERVKIMVKNNVATLAQMNKLDYF